MAKYWREIYESYHGTADFIKKVNCGEVSEDSVIFNKLSSMLPHVMEDVCEANISSVSPVAVETMWLLIAKKMTDWFVASKPIVA
jgi:hypothetical protein